MIETKNSIKTVETFVRESIKLLHDIEVTVTASVDPKGVSCLVIPNKEEDRSILIGIKGRNAELMRDWCRLGGRRLGGYIINIYIPSTKANIVNNGI